MIHPDERTREEKLAHLTERLIEMLDSGKDISVLVAETEEMLSPQRVGEILGFSRQHVRRLIDAGELEAEQIPNSSHWRIPFSAVTAFEERREEASDRADKFSRELDEMGAPLE